MSNLTDPSAYIEELRRDRERFAALDGSSVELGRPVQACPDWDITALIVHLGRIHRWAAGRVILAPNSDDASFPPRPAEDVALIDWLAEGLDQLIELLSSTDLDEPCWSFMGPTTRRWWVRRQGIETAIHRWDAQQASDGRPDPIDGGVAAGGVSEWCEFAAQGRFQPADDLTGSVHLHSTDGDGEWIVEATPDSFTWRHGHEKGDVAVRATRSDLLLMLWSRIPHSDVEVFGDGDLLRRVLAAAAR